MTRRQKVGTGITRHALTTFDMLDPKDWEAADTESQGYVFPPHNFPSWLDQYEEKLAERARRQRLPERGNICLVYDADTEANGMSRSATSGRGSPVIQLLVAPIDTAARKLN